MNGIVVTRSIPTIRLLRVEGNNRVIIMEHRKDRINYLLESLPGMATQGSGQDVFLDFRR